MIENKLKENIDSYLDFPKEGILFRDILPILENPGLMKELIKKMATNPLWEETDALIAIDARGFIFGSCLSLELNKPLITARKPNKIPGEIIEKKYDLEYGSNSLSIQKKAINNYNSFGIIDDLLATGGTAKCVEDIIKSCNKEIKLLSVVVELKELQGRKLFDFETESQIFF